MLEHVKERLTKKPTYLNSKQLYRCYNFSCVPSFAINPQGILRFCFLSDRNTTNLKKYTLKKGLKKILDALAVERDLEHKCFGCKYLRYCHNCPAMSFLEVGDERAAVEYFCEWAEATKKLVKSLKNHGVSLKN